MMLLSEIDYKKTKVMFIDYKNVEFYNVCDVYKYICNLLYYLIFHFVNVNGA